MTDAQQNTPLHLATMHGNVDVARVCLSHGADRSATNGSNQRPKDMAVFVQDPALRQGLQGLLAE
jgi:ankyrin repeat protein